MHSHVGVRGQVKDQKIQGRGYPYNKKEMLDSPESRFPVLCSAGTVGVSLLRREQAVNSVRVRPRYPGTIRITEGRSSLVGGQDSVVGVVSRRLVDPMGRGSRQR